MVVRLFGEKNQIPVIKIFITDVVHHFSDIQVRGYVVVVVVTVLWFDFLNRLLFHCIICWYLLLVSYLPSPFSFLQFKKKFRMSRDTTYNLIEQYRNSGDAVHNKFYSVHHDHEDEEIIEFIGDLMTTFTTVTTIDKDKSRRSTKIHLRSKAVVQVERANSSFASCRWHEDTVIQSLDISKPSSKLAESRT